MAVWCCLPISDPAVLRSAGLGMHMKYLTKVGGNGKRRISVLSIRTILSQIKITGVKDSNHLTISKYSVFDSVIHLLHLNKAVQFSVNL